MTIVRPRTVISGGGGGYWGSRPPSPGGSESSSIMPPHTAPRPKSRGAPTAHEAKYNNLNYWRARKVGITVVIIYFI